MKLKNILSTIILFLLACEAVLLAFSPIVKANGGTIPENYYQDLNLNGLYVYNVTAFGLESTWTNSSWAPVGQFFTNEGGQIHLQITGFYEDAFDSFSFFTFPIPFMNVTIYNKTGTGLNNNFQVENVSQNCIANNLFLAYYGYFTPGFLIPLNYTWLDETAKFAAEDSGVVNLRVEETYNFIHFDFNESSGSFMEQQTELTYDKKTGLLVYAKTSHKYGYNLEISSLNYSLSYNTAYNFDVIQFGEHHEWYNFSIGDSFEGFFTTNPKGVVQVNFTGDFNKDINDVGNIFNDPIPWMNISIFKDNGEVLTNNLTLYNRSNSEVARALILGYENFQSGIRANIENLTHLKELAFQQKDGINQGNVSIIETGLYIRINYEQYPSGQKTYLIYEKITGLLLWTETTNDTYSLKLSLSYDSVFESDPSSPPTSDNSLNPPDIIYLPYLIVIAASLAIGVPFGFVKRIDVKTKKALLIAAIGVGSFSGLLFFNNNMDAISRLFISQQEEVENITLIIDYSNGTIDRWDNFSLTEGKTTVYDAVDKWCDVEVEYFASLGYQVVCINGRRESGLSGWTYKVMDVNGNPKALPEVTKSLLSDGDTITFTYQI